MRRRARLPIVLAIAVVLVVDPSLADDELSLFDVSLGFAYEEDFQSGNGGWDTTEFPPPPPRILSLPSWQWGAVVPRAATPRPLNNSSWEWGEPANGVGPGQGPWGKLWATNLSGLHNDSECSGILSPPIDLTDPSLVSAAFSFSEWRHFERTTETGTLFDMGMLFVTANNGDTLTRIANPAPPYTTGTPGSTARACLDAQPTGVGGYGGPVEAPAPVLTPVSADLTPYIGQTIRVLIGFGADSGGARAGWYIDDFTVTTNSGSGPVSVTEDFESSSGGFSVVGVRPKTPMGPDVAFSGDNVWATGLGGPHNDNECSGLLSPPITVPAGSNVSASFMQWRHMQKATATGASSDAGRLFVTADAGKTLIPVDDPTPAYDGGSLLTQVARCFDEIPTSSGGYGGPVGTSLPPVGYSKITADLSSFAGKTVQLLVAFGSNTLTAQSGWYIDDFEVTVDGAQEQFYDFETNDGGFTVVGVQPAPHPKGWEWGEPSTGPGFEGDPRKVWATQLHGNYGHPECSWIESPPFQVGPVPQAVNEVADVMTATLSFNHWVRTNSIYSSAVVQVGHNGQYHVVTPEGGYPATIGSTSASFAEVTQFQTDCFGMDWNPGEPLKRAYSGTSSPGGHALGAPMVNQRVDLSAFAGEQVTLRFVFAAGWSTSNPVTHPGWYINDVDVEVRMRKSVTSPEKLLESGNDAPGWSSGGPANQWAYGTATSGPEGDTAYGTKLDGPYTRPHCGFIESPAVSGSTFAGDPSLSFEHWYQTDQSGSFAWHSGVVFASTDDGATWNVVPFPGQFNASTASRNCINPLVGLPSSTTYGAFAGAKTEWSTATADLSAYVGADSVKLRFVFGTDSSCSSSASKPCEGWFIRNVVLGGKDIGPGTLGSLLPDVPAPSVPAALPPVMPVSL